MVRWSNFLNDRKTGEGLHNTLKIYNDTKLPSNSDVYDQKKTIVISAYRDGKETDQINIDIQLFWPIFKDESIYKTNDTEMYNKKLINFPLLFGKSLWDKSLTTADIIDINDNYASNIKEYAPLPLFMSKKAREIPCLNPEGYLISSFTIEFIDTKVPNWFFFFKKALQNPILSNIGLVKSINLLDVRFANLEYSGDQSCIESHIKNNRIIAGYRSRSRFDAGAFENNVVVFGPVPMASLNCAAPSSINCNQHLGADLNSSILYFYGIVGFYTTLFHEFVHVEQQEEASIALMKVKHTVQEYEYGASNAADWVHNGDETAENYTNFVDLYQQDMKYQLLKCDLNNDQEYGMPTNQNPNHVPDPACDFGFCLIKNDIFSGPTIYNCKIGNSSDVISINIFGNHITSTSDLCGHDDYCILYETDMENLDVDGDGLPNIYDADACDAGIESICIDESFSITPQRFDRETKAYYEQNQELLNYFFSGNGSGLYNIEDKTNKGDW